jgi:cytochrome o ubiquinol oxidase subunit 2
LSRIRLIAAVPFSGVLGACQAVILNPSGDVGQQQRDLLVYATILMLIVIVPVMVMTVLFAWRYRQSNRGARYEPDWDHSIHLELLIWAAPLLIVIALGGFTWVGTHLLDPYRSLGRIRPGEPVAYAVKPLQVDVVALDWKWLFIYPQYGIATVNELAAPVDRPIDFRITSVSVMNSLFIPTLAGQVYAMPGMETRLHAVANTAGDYQGFSANYSGAGFSDMRFVFRALGGRDFDQWLARVKAGGGVLTRSDYLRLARPSESEPARGFAGVDASLYHAILNRCVGEGTRCTSAGAAVDATGDVARPPQDDEPLRGAGLSETVRPEPVR